MKNINLKKMLVAVSAVGLMSGCAKLERKPKKVL